MKTYGLLVVSADPAKVHGRSAVLYEAFVEGPCPASLERGVLVRLGQFVCTAFDSIPVSCLKESESQLAHHSFR